MLKWTTTLFLTTFLLICLQCSGQTDSLISDSLSRKYATEIHNGDSCFAIRDYARAKAFYQKAAQLKPLEQYPKVRIAECDNRIHGPYVRDHYGNLISKADKLFVDQKYAEAKTCYQQASEIRPTERYPKDQIALIDKCCGQADSLKLDSLYNLTIYKGDSCFKETDYESAMAYYKKASELKPTELYPQNQYHHAYTCFLQQWPPYEVQKKKKDWNSLILKADSCYMKGNYSEAKNYYEEAIKLYPADSPVNKYPQDQIDKIENLLKDK